MSVTNNKHWFPDQGTLPNTAIETITTHLLTLHQQVVLTAETLCEPFWHNHPTYPITSAHHSVFSACQACQTLTQLKEHLRQLFIHTGELVMNFYDTPEQHHQLEGAVRLYTWSLFQLTIFSDQTLIKAAGIRTYARSQLEALYVEHLVSTWKEQQGNEVPASSTQVTSKAEMNFLIRVFVTVYTHLEEELTIWRQEKSEIIPLAFPAKAAHVLLQQHVARHWPMSNAILEQCVVSLPLYEWDLLAILLEIGAHHSLLCEFLENPPSGTLAWIPNAPQSLKERTVTQTRPFWKGLISLLNRLHHHYGTHSNDEAELAQWVPSLEMRRALMKRYHDFNGSPDDYKADLERDETYQWETLGGLTWYLARRIETQITH